jgi:3-dehydroquinate synthase
VVEIRGARYCYSTLVGSGLIRQLGKQVHKLLPGSTCAIISDTNVAAIFARRVKRSLESAGLKPTLVTIPAGEKSKTLQQAGIICEQMLAAGLDRQSFVIGLGGGVVGDVSGFVAAIYIAAFLTSRFRRPCLQWWIVDRWKDRGEHGRWKKFNRRNSSSIAGDR